MCSVVCCASNRVMCSRIVNSRTRATALAKLWHSIIKGRATTKYRAGRKD